MDSHQEETKILDYDPKMNSFIGNYILSTLDGGFEKGSLPCSLDTDDSLYSKSITLAEFPLYKVRCPRGFGVFLILMGLLGIGAIVAAALSSLSLSITIPIAVILIVFSVFTGVVFYAIPQNKHRFVLVELYCRKCNGEHTVLYDAITQLKRRRFGFYTNPTCKTLQVSSTERSFEFIELAFEEMRDGLDHPCLGCYNCKDWANDLYKEIA